MAELEDLVVYRDYMEALHAEVRRVPEDEQIDLLSPGEVIDLLIVRDQLSSAALTAEQRRELDRLDDLLVQHHQIIADNLLPVSDKPRWHWWWHLREGPQVRERAPSAA